MTDEEMFVRAFMVPQRRKRYLEFLQNQSGREKIKKRLAHSLTLDLDERYAHRIQGSQHSPEAILALLRQKGAPHMCRAISENEEIDGREIELGSALKIVVGCQMGTVLSCLPGRLAYYEAEEMSERYLLDRMNSSLTNE